MKSISLVNREEFQFYEIIHKNGLDFEREYSQEETKFFITFQLRSILDNKSLPKEAYQDFVQWKVVLTDIDSLL